MSPNTESHLFQEDVQWMDDLPPGGDLEKYRSSATFCWKHFRIVLEDPDKIRLKVNIFIILSQFIYSFMSALFLL